MIAFRQAANSIVALSLLFATAPGNASEWRFDDVDRVVAMSDIHGAYGAMTATLANAGVVDAEGRWSGGSTHLVITGDLLDRGPDSRLIMDYVMRLEAEAEAAGGRVHLLLGNHEVMNLVGDLRYVALEEYAAFAEDEDAEIRERWFQRYAERAGVDPSEDPELRSRFDESHPPGFFAHRQAFSADGVYGAWLLDKPLVVVVNETAFVHGGLSPLIAEMGLDGVNRTLGDDLNDYVRLFERLLEDGVLLPGDNFYDHAAISSRFVPGLDTPPETVSAINGIRELRESGLHALDGPLWYRGNVFCGPLIESGRLGVALDSVGATRVVIGHTPTPNRRVLVRLDGRVIEVDTGMLSGYYNGLGHALVLEGETASVISELSTEPTEPMPHPRRVGGRPAPGISSENLERLLTSGEVSEITVDAAGRNVVTVSDGSVRVDAVFSERAGRGFYPDVAAYRLDRMLALDAVPVAVVREVDGVDGSLQFLPHRWMDEQQRADSGRGGSAPCPLDVQWVGMYTFDALIYNEGRTRPRTLYSTDSWQLVLIGHEDAFSTRRGRPRHLSGLAIDLDDSWRESLSALTEEGLEAELGDVLDARRLRALLARRDEMLED
ncbi:MAG: metallophosphoesterase [Woeseiaceae bacterium]|nr:metallophosphoesterase [Woeseiaceae bacterium]